MVWTRLFDRSDASRGAWMLSVLVAVGPTAVALVGWDGSDVRRWSLEVAGLVSGAVGVLQIVNSGIRRVVGHHHLTRGKGYLRREWAIAAGLVVLAISLFQVAAAPLLLQTAAGMLIFPLWLFVILAYDTAGREIANEVTATGMQTVSSWLRERIEGWGRLGAPQGPANSEAPQTWTQNALDKLFGPAAGLSQLRSYAINANVLAFLVAGIPLFGTAAVHAAGAIPVGGGATITMTSQTGPETDTASGGTALDDTTVRRPLWWTDICPTEPGFDSPAWAAPQVHALYLGGLTASNTDPPPGAVGGCTGASHVLETVDGVLVYVTGTDMDTRETLSIGVVSDLGAAIFQGPAVPDVLMLMRRYGVVGPAGPRTPVAGGDLYLVATMRGTALLIRRRILSAEGAGEAYVLLEPAAATAFIQELGAQGRWLWPIVRYRMDGIEDIKLLPTSTSSIEDAVTTLSFEPPSGLAWRASGDRYGPTGLTMTLANLQSLIATAR